VWVSANREIDFDVEEHIIVEYLLQESRDELSRNGCLAYLPYINSVISLVALFISMDCERFNRAFVLLKTKEGF
jgi:hypothetical protein